MSRVGIYAGTFDPVTNGHLDIVGRAARLVDQLVIGVAVSDEKAPMFSPERRSAMLRDALATTGIQARVETFDCLLMHFAEQVGASIIIRGLRAVSDFEFEFQMVGMNRVINKDIVTVFLMADPALQAISSRLVKEIARLHGDVSTFVPASVLPHLAERLARPAPE